MMFVAALLIAGCATSEERAARKAEQQKMVKESVSAQIEEVKAQKKYHNFAELLETNDIWEVK